MHPRGILLAVLVLVAVAAKAQERLEGAFDQATVGYGETVKYTLVYQHDPDLEVLMPDSAFDYAPFEYASHQYFPTRTDSTGSIDSVVYTLWAFDIGAEEVYALPVFIMVGSGKRENYPEPDTIRLEEIITELPDTVKLKSNTSFRELTTEINKTLVIMIGLLVVISLVVAFLVFKDKVLGHFRYSRLQKQKLKFIKQMDQYIHSGLGKQDIQEAVSYWKKESGKLHGLPIQSYTTREVSATLNDDLVTEALKASDRSIYASQLDESIKAHLHKLKDYTTRLFDQKMKEVKHG